MRIPQLALTTVLVSILAASQAVAEVPVWGLYAEPRLPSEFVCHDALHHRLVAFGAEGDASQCFSVWMLDLGQPPRWTRTNPGGPGPRIAPIVAAVHDPVFGRVFLYQNAKF